MTLRFKIAATTVLLLLVLNLLFVACGDTATLAPQASTTVSSTSQVPPTATQSNAQNKVGQELVGQTAKKGNLQASISKVQALAEIKDDFKKQVLKPTKGMFLLVFFDLKNSGTTEETFSLAQINDNNGTALENAAFDADFALSSSKNAIPFTPNSIVQPGGSGQDFKLFDISTNATGLKFSLP